MRDTLRSFEYKRLLQTCRFLRGNGQSVVQININEVKSGVPTLLTSTQTS